MGVINLTKDSPAGSQLLMIDVDFTKELIPTILGNAYDRVGNFCCSKDFSRIYCKNASSWELVSVGGGGGGGGSYTAGNGIAIAGGVIRAKADNDTIKFTQDGTMYAKDTTYTAGANITISDQNVISSDSHMYLATYGTSTWQQIHDAYYAGKAVFCLHPSQNYLMMMIQEGPNNEFHFATAKAFGNITAYVNTSNHWGVRYYSLYEEAGNGISISRSDNVDSKATVSAKVDGTTIGFDGSGNLKALGGSYTAGTGIDITEGAISTKIDGSTITVNSSGQLQANGGGGATYTSGEGITVNNTDHTISLSHSMAFTSNNIETEVIAEDPDSGTMWQTKGETVDDTLRLDTGTIEFTLGTHANEVCEFQVQYITHNYITGEDDQHWYGSDETSLGYTIDKLKIETANNIIVIYAKPIGVSTWNQLDTFSITNLIVHYQGFFKNCTAVTVSTATGTMTDPVYPLPHDGRLDDCFDSPGYFKVGNKRVPIIDLTTQKQKIFDHTCVGISYDGTYSYIYDFYRDGYSLMCEDEKTPVNITINLDRSGDPITASFGMYDNTWFDPEEPDIIGSYDESATGHEMIYSVQFKAAWDYEEDGFMPKFICRGKSQNIVYETPDVESAYYGPNGFFIRIPGRIDDLKDVGYVQEDQTGVYFQYETKAEEEFNTPSSDRDIAVSNEDNTLVAYEGFGRALNMFNNDHILTDGALIMRIDNKTHDAGEWTFEILNEYEEAIITLTHDEVATGKKIKAVYYTKDINGARVIVTDDSGDNHISNLFWCKRSEKCYFRLKYSETDIEDLYGIFDLINFTGLYEKQSTILTADAKTYGYVKIDEYTIITNENGLITTTESSWPRTGKPIFDVYVDDAQFASYNSYIDIIDTSQYFMIAPEMTIAEGTTSYGIAFDITSRYGGNVMASTRIEGCTEKVSEIIANYQTIETDDYITFTVQFETADPITKSINITEYEIQLHTCFGINVQFDNDVITIDPDKSECGGYVTILSDLLTYLNNISDSDTIGITPLGYLEVNTADSEFYGVVKIDDNTIKINGDGQIYAAGGGGGSYTAGQGIEIDDNTIKAKVDGTTISFNNNGELVAVGSSSDDTFIAIYPTTSIESITTAYNAGKTIFCKYTNDNTTCIMNLDYAGTNAEGNTYYEFSSIDTDKYLNCVSIDSLNGWGEVMHYLLTGSGSNYNVPDFEIDEDAVWIEEDYYFDYSVEEFIMNIDAEYTEETIITIEPEVNSISWGSKDITLENCTSAITKILVEPKRDGNYNWNIDLTIYYADETQEKIENVLDEAIRHSIFRLNFYFEGQTITNVSTLNLLYHAAALTPDIEFDNNFSIDSNGLITPIKKAEQGIIVNNRGAYLFKKQYNCSPTYDIRNNTIWFNLYITTNGNEMIFGLTGEFESNYSIQTTIETAYANESVSLITTGLTKEIHTIYSKYYEDGSDCYIRFTLNFNDESTEYIDVNINDLIANNHEYFTYNLKFTNASNLNIYYTSGMAINITDVLDKDSVNNSNTIGITPEGILEIKNSYEDRIVNLESKVKELTALVEKLTMTEEPETEEPKIKE